MDFDSVFTGAAFLLAIASPIISTGLNIWHQQRMKKIELNFLYQTETIENFLSAVSSVINCDSAKNENDYYLAYGKIYSAIPEQFWPLVDEIDVKIRSQDMYQAIKPLRELSKELAKTYNLRAKI